MSTSRLVPILSDALIDAALRRAERKVCAPGDPRCYGFPYTVEDALRSMTPDGWCRIGWVAARSRRASSPAPASRAASAAGGRRAGAPG
jgi:hypothetical protein